jgi:hypothetical protein
MTASIIRATRSLLIVTVLMCGLHAHAVQPQTVQDTTNVPCDQASGWFAVEFASHTPIPVTVTKAPGTFREGAGALEFKYSRSQGTVPSLVKQVVLTNLHAITIDLWSQEDTTVAVVTQDRDKASFHKMIPIKGGAWQQVVIRPADFELNTDSPTTKSAMEPRRLGAGLLIADFAGLLGKTGANTLRIDKLTVERGTLQVVDLPQTLDGKTLSITENSLLKGNTVIRNAGKLLITAPRAIIAGSIDAAHGELSATGTVLTMQGRFAHDLTLSAEGGSQIRFANCLFASPYMSSMHLNGKSLLAVKDTEFEGAGFTTDTKESSSVDLDHVKGVGEVIVSTDVRYSIRDCETVMLWLTPSGIGEKRLRLPNGTLLPEYSLPAATGFDVHVRNCKGIVWGLISATGTNIVVDGSNLGAVGILFGGNVKETITGIRNNQPMTEYKFNVSDRTLSFSGSSVGAWNFYAAQNSDITLNDCVVGESFTFGSAKMALDNCTVDGTGGYVCSSGKSMKLSKCHITCDVVSQGNSDVTLDDCDVTGSVHASAESVIHLIRTKVSGKIQSLDKGHITVADN